MLYCVFSGIADRDATIRRTVLTSLVRNPRLLQQLSIDVSLLRALFIAVHDDVLDIRYSQLCLPAHAGNEKFGVRLLAMELLGRLATLNSLHVMSLVRKLLVQLLVALQFSGQLHMQLVCDRPVTPSHFIG